MNSTRGDRTVEVTPLGRGMYRVDDGERIRIAYAAGPADARWVFLDGTVYVIEVDDRSAAGSPEGLPHSSRPDSTPAVAQRFGAPGSSVAQRVSAAGRKRRDHGGDLSAPMPATVVTINVTPGQRVSRGDVLIMLEAMKMELPVKSPRDGTVKSVACQAGELVQPGVPLLELE